MAVRFVIVGAGPAGVQAATQAARLDAEVTLVERDVIGGSANLWDCIPSKAMISTGGLLSVSRRSQWMGLCGQDPALDLGALRERIERVTSHLEHSFTQLMANQGVRVLRGPGALKSAHEVVADTAEEGPVELEADAILLATGSRPRVPEWVEVDGDKVMVTRQAYPPPTVPERLVVIGSGVTGVEFVHMFRSFGSEVTLIVSRQQVLPQKDPEVAAALEDDFLRRGVVLCKGARAEGIDREEGGVTVRCNDGRVVPGSHALLAIGSVPNSEDLGLASAGVRVDDRGYVPVNKHLQSNVGHVYAAGDLSGKLPLASVAMSQGRKVAEHVMGLHSRTHRHLDYDKAASAIFTEPEVADVGLAEAEAFAE
ncbi:MAG TPA: FAD-dependent oxidoreductase, partial [Acidimicrobiales bacterium]|nr:FAD-dependent oxidoreductase [Acidimicrobiales bacterium]